MLMLLDFKVPWGPSTNKKYCNLLKCLKYRNGRFVQDHAPRILRKNLLKCLRYILIQDYEGKVQYKGFLLAQIKYINTGFYKSMPGMSCYVQFVVLFEFYEGLSEVENI